MKIVIRGIGWDMEVPATIEDDNVVIDRNEFNKMMSGLSYTHDVVSGGFKWEFEDEDENEEEDVEEE